MIQKPEKCTPIGEYKCTIPMPANGRVRDVDFCIAHIVAALNAGGVTTLESCCGHGVANGYIALDDGRMLTIPLSNTSEKRGMLSADMNLGMWMSAALDDPKVCKEMKMAIEEWFASFRE